ncbi:hypothetical protein [Streptomyces sp. SID13031]|uniref:hypothetical protein n=1 Tax=Streptomyces sp. SID13031 TaxID=2706046 RepID=UPI0019428C5B|nr:hypothetical protein [Streptomyces sp. SID13031]
MAAALLAVAGFVAGTAGTANAQPQSLYAKVVVIGVPGLTWFDVKSSPELTALVDQSHVGSITVKTAGPHTCPVDGWLTISAGTRAWGSVPDQACGELPTVADGKVQNWQTYVDRQAEHHTGAPLGRLAESRERVCGFGPGAAIALAHSNGTVENWTADLDPALLASPACGDAIIDAGAMPLREGRDEARKKVADLVAQARAADGWVLLVGISQLTATAHQEPLVAMQLPPDNGPRWLTSDSTRRPGLIQLTDVTATILRGEAKELDPAGQEQPGPLDGNEIGFGGDRHTDASAVIEDRLDTNERFEHPRPVLIAVVVTLVVAQLAALGWFLITRSRRARSTSEFTLLAEGGFFIAVFLSTATVWWRWPSPGLSLYFVVLAISAGFAAVARTVLKQWAALGVLLAAYLVLLVDGVLGTPLQFGSMFADGPVIGGRFYGFGNSTFATLAVAALVTAGWVAQRLLDRGQSRVKAALAVLAIGGLAIIVDGKPGWGTDFGGIIALTPAVLLMAWLTWRGSITLKALVGIGIAGVLAVSAVAFLDFLRPEDQRSHFGTFVARLLDGDVSDVLIRKLEMALAFFHTPAGWFMLAGVVLAMIATVWPDKVPFESYRRFYASRPMIRPTLLALSTCGLVGMLLNDAGVALPAIMTGFALPLLVAHLLAATVSPESHLVQESSSVDRHRQ